MTAINTSAATFEQDVIEPAKEGPVVVAFTADWCGPCKLLKPKLIELAAAWEFRLAVVNAGVDRELAATYGVRGVPTVLVLENGAERLRFSGDRAESELKKLLRTEGLAQTELEF